MLVAVAQDLSAMGEQTIEFWYQRTRFSYSLAGYIYFRTYYHCKTHWNYLRRSVASGLFPIYFQLKFYYLQVMVYKNLCKEKCDQKEKYRPQFCNIDHHRNTITFVHEDDFDENGLIFYLTKTLPPPVYCSRSQKSVVAKCSKLKSSSVGTISDLLSPASIFVWFLSFKTVASLIYIDFHHWKTE